MFGKSLTRENRNSTIGDHNEHLIELRGVVKNFESAPSTFRALCGVDLQVDAGEFLVVIGKSGSGKSTLFNLIAGIDRPTAGEVFVMGQRVNTMSEDALARWRGENVGIVFQFFQMLPGVTLLDNVVLPMELAHKYKPQARRERARQLLDMVGLADQAYKLPAFVSGGQQQRAAVARALANDPPLILADEPTGNLDSASAQAIFDLFQRVVKEGKTLLMVTHDSELASAVPRRIEIKDGRITTDDCLGTGSPAGH